MNMDLIQKIVELMEQTSDNDGYMTTEQLAKHFKVDTRTARKYLHILDEQFGLDVKKVPVKMLSKNMTHVIAYRIKGYVEQNSNDEH